ncbi:MAG: type II secretion system F family protein [Candidatus Altiarchaeota archaeon]
MPASVKMPFLGNPDIRKIARYFLWVGSILSKAFPYTDLVLKQSGIAKEYSITAREFMSICFIVTSVAFIAPTTFIHFLFKAGGQENLLLSSVLGGLLGGVMCFYFLVYPKSIVGKRVKYLERNLLFALRSILVQIRSGVPIFNTLVSIAQGDYGPISEEFRMVVEKVNSGSDMVSSLEELAVRNPSPYFRRSLWQLVNSMKSGSDVGENLSEVIRSLSKEQIVEIRKYKSILNPLAMMYMMIAVIMPSMGVTMLIILSSFPGMEAIGSEQTFWILLAALMFMQVIFIGIIKSKRPNLIGT